MTDTERLLTIAAVTSAQTEGELLARMQAAAKSIGFDYALFGIEWRQLHHPILHITSGWPQEYQRIYAERGLIAVDPTVPHCQTKTDILVWSEEIYTTPASHEVLEESRRAGLPYGVSFPIADGRYVRGMLSLGRDRPLGSESEKQEVFAGGMVLASCVHMVIKRIAAIASPRRFEEALTPRERECLQWLTEGKSNTDIADILNISVNAVEFHVKGLFRKLKVSNRVMAASIAIELDLISPRSLDTRKLIDTYGSP